MERFLAVPFQYLTLFFKLLARIIAYLTGVKHIVTNEVLAYEVF